MRIVQWFLRQHKRPDMLCLRCQADLVECPACEGNWRLVKCRRCCLGQQCHVHGQFWY